MSPTANTSPIDLLVIGGGINGAGVARDAALRGYSVALVEQHDFASGSSSRTSKLVHGGLRYLENGDLRLVWEACHERRILLRTAPHLVRPQSFVLPVFRDSRVGSLRLHVGMWLYDLMAAFRNVQRHRMLDLPTLRRSWPEIRAAGLRAAALYWDAAMDDARLTLENVLAARQAGAEVSNYTRVDRLLVGPQGVTGALVTEQESGVQRHLTARLTIACAGAWTQRLLGTLHDAGDIVSPTRGTHIVTRRFTDQAWTLTATRDGRVFFVLPWLGLNLIGTTDVPDDGKPEDVTATDEEITFLLDEANAHFPTAALQSGDVVSAFAGLRPLAASTRQASSRSREHTILQPAPGLLSVVGGKYTTFRAVAEELVDRAATVLGARQACRTAREPLPGGRLSWTPQEHWDHTGGFERAVRELQRCGVPAPTAAHWCDTYGAGSADLAALVRDDPALLTPLCTDLPHTEAEVVHAVRVEMARHLDDWYLRRSQIGMRPCHGLDSLARVAELFARERGWSPGRRDQERESARRLLERVAVSGPLATRRSA
jgi:glycerol-3-phosphate dehydrogenase